MAASQAEVRAKVDIIEALEQFIGEAERNGNYPPNTAGGIRAALRLLATVLDATQIESLSWLRSNLDGIFGRAYNKNRASISAGSLQTYRARINTLLADYEKYGQNPRAMAGWRRKVRTQSKRNVGTTDLSSGDQDSKRVGLSDLLSDFGGPTMNRLELSLRPNAKAVVVIPSDLTADEARRIKMLIDASVVGKNA